MNSYLIYLFFSSLFFSSLIQATQKKTKIEGYGELHYENTDRNYYSMDENNDFYQLGFFLEHSFNNNFSFFSEGEIKNKRSNENQNNEIEFIQAYLKKNINNHSFIKLGLFMLPIGIINEGDELSPFYGIENNPIEESILPSTNGDGGISIHTQFLNGFYSDIVIHSHSKETESIIQAKQWIYSIRLKYTGFFGLEFSISYQKQKNIHQKLNISNDLYSVHAIYHNASFSLRTLYVYSSEWIFNNKKQIKKHLKKGFYIEPHYKINEQFEIFAGYNTWNHLKYFESINQKKQHHWGAYYWPNKELVFKLDIEHYYEKEAHSKQLNISIAYQF
jgi:predicted porin